MLYNLFPKFKIVEINNVAALRMGHIIAQTPAKVNEVPTTTVGSGDNAYKFLENGAIVGYDEAGTLKSYDATKHTQPCLVYTEELITADMTNGLDQFADLFVNGVVYPRALPLNLGDTFTTNNFTGTLADGFGAVENGVIKIQEGRAGAMFIVKKSDLPAGQDAIECTYIGYIAPVASSESGN